MTETKYYIIGPTNLLSGLLQSEKDNRAVRYSLDGTQMLLKGTMTKFENVIQHVPSINIVTIEEAYQFVQNNKEDWELDPDTI